MTEKPIWQSKKHIVYLMTLSATIALAKIGAPEGVVSKLADAIWLGLPILLAGQAWIDKSAISARSQKNEDAAQHSD